MGCLRLEPLGLGTFEEELIAITCEELGANHRERQDGIDSGINSRKDKEKQGESQRHREEKS